MRRILCLHLPYLETQRAWQDAARSPDSPVKGGAGEPAFEMPDSGTSHTRPLVLTRTVGSSLLVSQACPLAQAAGVRPGISLGQACAMVPDLLAWPSDPARDAATLRRLAIWAMRFSPLVEPDPPHMLLLDITGCARLFGGELNIARLAVDGLSRRGFFARAAIADTLGAAWALAFAGGESLVLVPPGHTPAHLAPLPPAALRIDPPTVERLEAAGLRTIGDLLMIPRSLLPARFGAGLVRRLEQALGERVEPVAPLRPDTPPFARASLDPPCADRAALLATARGLLDDVVEQLRERGLALQRLDCVLYRARRPRHGWGQGDTFPPPSSAPFSDQPGSEQGAGPPTPSLPGRGQGKGRSVHSEHTAGRVTASAPPVVPPERRDGQARSSRSDRSNGSPLVLCVQLARPTRDAAHIRPLLDRQFERLHGAPPRGDVPVNVLSDSWEAPAFTGLMLVARRLARCAPEQADLFLPREPGIDEAIGVLVDRLAAQLGHEAIVRPRLIDDHQPEFAQRWISAAEAGCLAWNGADGDGGDRQATSDAPAATRPRPVRLLARPRPIRALALAPDGAPAWLAWAGREHRVAIARGPERIETAWWRGRDVQRDYFRVMLDTGERLWVFRPINADGWYLHGLFV